MRKEIDKTEIERNLKNNLFILNNFEDDSLKFIKKYLNEFDTKISERELKVKEILYEIEFLKIEKEKRIEKINELEKEGYKLIVKVYESKKQYKFDSYELFVSLREVTKSSNFLVGTIECDKLSFQERVTIRDSYLLRWINDNNVEEIHTNIDLSKFIKKNNLENIKVIYKENE